MASVETDAEAALTRSFRFGNAVADAATSILKVLGEKRRVVGDPHKDTRIAAAGSTRTVLCRTNAGVVSVVVDSLAQGRRPHVVGGVADLIRLLEDVSKLKRSVPAESPEFFGFKDWAEVVDFAESDEGESLRSFVKIVLAHGEVSLIQKLESVAREEGAGDLIVSTGHKAKGREWDSVSLFSDFEPRLSKDDPPKPVLNEEEARLLYVATTRARQLLVVPPRLAEKWNVPAAPAPAPEVARVQPGTVPRPPTKSPLPSLPSFASVVGPPSIESSPLSTRPSTPATARKVVSAVPRPAPAPALEIPSSTRAAAGHQRQDPQPSLLSIFLSLFQGKK